MNFTKKLGVIFASIAFFLSLAVVTADAQRNRSWNSSSNGSWQNRSRQNRNWNARRWQNRNNQSWQYRNRRTSRITPQEYWRLQRQRTRLYNTRNRYASDGYLSDKDRRKLQKRYLKYRRNVNRDRRDW